MRNRAKPIHRFHRFFQKSICVICGCLVFVSLATAQQPSPSPDSNDAPVQAGENAGQYTIISTFEFGYRGLQVVGDLNKYQSDLNYRTGPRLFDSSFLMRSQDGKNGGLFDTALLTTTGWGADPNGTVRFNVEKPEWYRFDGTYRKFNYFRFVNSFANPNWVFSPSTFSVPPKLASGEHGTDTRMQ